MSRLLDLPDEKGRYPFTYRTAAQTDLRARFEAERKRIAAELKQEQETKVRQIKRAKR